MSFQNMPNPIYVLHMATHILHSDYTLINKNI